MIIKYIIEFNWIVLCIPCLSTRDKMCVDMVRISALALSHRILFDRLCKWVNSRLLYLPFLKIDCSSRHHKSSLKDESRMIQFPTFIHKSQHLIKKLVVRVTFLDDILNNKNVECQSIFYQEIPKLKKIFCFYLSCIRGRLIWTRGTASNYFLLLLRSNSV
jgi:hypothetical protein